MSVIKVVDQIAGLYRHILDEQTALRATLKPGEDEKARLGQLVDDLALYYEAYRSDSNDEAQRELEFFLQKTLREICKEPLPPSLSSNHHNRRLIHLFTLFWQQIQRHSSGAGGVWSEAAPPFPPAGPALAKDLPEDRPAPAADESPAAEINAAPDSAEQAAEAEAEVPPDAPEPLAPPAAPRPAPSHPEGPTISVGLKIAGSDGQDQRPYELLCNIIDRAPSIMGRYNEEFEYSLDLDVDKYFSIQSVDASAELSESLGLAVVFENQRIIIKGLPRIGFDGRLNFVLSAAGRTDGGRLHQKPMYIAADPRTLWQDLPVEDDQGYPAENELWSGRQLPDGGRRILAASRRGRSHAHAAKTRDDYYALDFDQESGWHFAAVADGAGSARYSRKGAELACETAVAKLREYLTDPYQSLAIINGQSKLAEWKTAFDAGEAIVDGRREKAFRAGTVFDKIIYRVVYNCYVAINDEAGAKGALVRDYHTTLLCAAFRKFSFGWFFVSYWVGDGAMALYDWNRLNRTLLLGVPDSGEFAGQTRFLTMMKEEINEEAVCRRTRYTFADDFEALLLMTDGLTDPFFPAEKDVLSEENWRTFWTGILKDGFDGNPGCPELFDGGLSPEEQSLALCQWLNFWSKGNHDDRTILIVK
jgi:serine/threonine protein phosphatase PrpC